MALILIVDDSPTEVHVMQKALERHGYRTAVAGDGAEGIRLARQMHPDLIFMDIVMPGINGYQATRTLVNDPDTRADSDRHGHFQGTGDGSHLGPAAGCGRLSWSNRCRRTSWSRRRRPRLPPDMPESLALRVLRDRPFELLRRARAAWPRRHRQPRAPAVAAASGSGWRCAWPGSCIWWRARRPARCSACPSPLTRVPGAKSWILGLANVRGQLLPVIDLRQYPGQRRRRRPRATTRVVVVNHRDIPAGLLVDEVLGFRRFAESEFTAEVPTDDRALRALPRRLVPPCRRAVAGAEPAHAGRKIRHSSEAARMSGADAPSSRADRVDWPSAAALLMVARGGRPALAGCRARMARAPGTAAVIGAAGAGRRWRCCLRACAGAAALRTEAQRAAEHAARRERAQPAGDPAAPR